MDFGNFIPEPILHPIQPVEQQQKSPAVPAKTSSTKVNAEKHTSNYYIHDVINETNIHSEENNNHKKMMSQIFNQAALSDQAFDSNSSQMEKGLFFQDPTNEFEFDKDEIIREIHSS